MLVSSVLNTVSFKNLSGNFPNRNNTLYNDRKMGALRLVNYAQRFDKDDVIYLQFCSDDNTVPTLKSYLYKGTVVIETISGSLVSSYIGVDNRYYFNFTVTLGSSYYDINSYFICTQGSDTLTSEPIFVEDLTDEIANGKMKKIQYANLDINSFSDSYFIDWTVLDYMYFYVESIDEYAPEGSIDLLEDVDQKVNIASKLFAAETFKTDGIPDYVCEKIIAASLLDVYTINDVQYVCNEIGEPERYGSSTLFQLSLSLTESVTSGLNVDDFGISEQQTSNTDVIVVKTNDNVTGSGWQVKNPSGYMLHSIQIKHNSASGATATVTCGTSIAGTDIIDAMSGQVDKATYLSKFANFPRHFLKDDSAAYDLYFSVSGAGADLTIIVNFDTITATA